MIVMRDTSNVHSQCSLGLLGRYFKLKLVIVSMFTLFRWARDAASATLPPWLVKTLERLSAPLMVVISPLNWLIKDQITSYERIGIKACKVELENSTSLLEVCDYDIFTISCLQAQRYLKIHWWQNVSRGTVTVSSELLLTSHIVLYSGEFFVFCFFLL